MQKYMKTIRFCRGQEGQDRAIIRFEEVETKTTIAPRCTGKRERLSGVKGHPLSAV